MPDVPAAVIAWCAAALFVGGFVKGVAGAGIPMLAVPLMSLVIPAPHAAALAILPVFPANLVQLRAGPPLLSKARRFMPLVAGIGAGTMLGGWWFTSGEQALAQGLISLIVFMFVAMRFASPDLAIAPRFEQPAGILLGVTAGALGGMAMLIGPMVVMYMTALRLERETFIGGLAFVYLASTVLIVGALAGYAQLSTGLLLASVLACIPALGGVWLGTRLRHRLSQRVFEQVLNALLLAIALSLMSKAVTGW